MYASTHTHALTHTQVHDSIRADLMMVGEIKTVS